MKKQFTIFLILVFIFGLAPVDFSNAEKILDRLKGRILLQVESKGEAWYINPDNSNRYYLGRPADAFSVMRELGLGISNKDFDFFNNVAPKRLSGKILLKVEDSGKAYYVNPIDLKMHFLGRPADAFQVMRNLGLGITNDNLDEIQIYKKYIEQSTIISLADIIKEWENRVVQVNCRWHSKDFSVITESYGSGLLFVVNNRNGLYFVNTNKHVVHNKKGNIADYCEIIFPKFNEKYIVSADFEKNIMPDISTLDGFDFAQITIIEPNIKIIDEIGTQKINICANKPDIGDKVVILGYPLIGSREGITATEGIISGLETGYFVTSAKIESGNSGGVAILLKNNCYLGIPTFVNIGDIESLGRILDINYFWN